VARKRTGLRNRFRDGANSTYGQRRKRNGSDLYGQPQAGQIEDIIAGHVLRYPVGQGQGSQKKLSIPPVDAD
jgi:hypothetical protein